MEEDGSSSLELVAKAPGVEAEVVVASGDHSSIVLHGFRCHEEFLEEGTPHASNQWLIVDASNILCSF